MMQRIHPDFRKYRFLRAPFTPLILRMAHPVQKFLLLFCRTPKDLTIEKITVPGYKELPVPVLLISRKDASEQTPYLLYFHGGGFGFSAASHHKKMAFCYALSTPCRVVFPDYHLLPDYPYPAAKEDAACVYRWLTDKGIIPAVAGDSAGGALAAGVCNSCTPTPCFQMLLYPVTDARMQTESMKTFLHTPLWDAIQNARMWKLYGENPDASPMLQALPNKLPDTYLETAEIDCLHDEGILYAERLQSAGCNVFLHKTQGTIHGYDVNRKSNITKESIRLRIHALRRAFHLEKEQTTDGKCN